MTQQAGKDGDAELAAEYALGLLEGESRQIARARVLTDADFAGLVVQWQETFAPLTDALDPVQPLKTSKLALESRMFGEPQRRSWWNIAGLWQVVSLASIAVAAFLAFTLVNLPDPEPGKLYIAELASENDALRVLAVYNDATNELQISRTNGGPATGRDLELWGIIEGEIPVSLGVLPRSATGSIELPADIGAAVDGLTLAVTDEPIGGSPTGQRTGDILAVAQISRI